MGVETHLYTHLPPCFKKLLYLTREVKEPRRASSKGQTHLLCQNILIFSLVTLYEGLHKLAAGVHLQVLLAGVGEAGAG